MYCKNCGQLIDDNALFCQHCGTKLNDSTPEPLNSNDSTPEIPSDGQPSKKGKNKLFIGIAVALVAIIAIFVLTTKSTPKLSADENKIYEAVLDLKSRLKNPDSLTLYGPSYIWVPSYSDGSGEEYMIIDYGGTNSYGAVLRSQAVFVDGEYLMDDGETPDLGPSRVHLPYRYYMTKKFILEGKAEYSVIKVDMKNIKAALGLK